MKKLTGIRLVNWHAFRDETIEIHNSTLLSGENGAGKSTILDAIQFVLTCSKNNFNKAANENSKRSLSGYVRYKTGRENNEYGRSGNVTCHIALEFYEENKKNYFVIGAVIDSASENSEKVLWYKIEKIRIKDIDFIKNDEPLDISNFKIAGQKFKINTYNRQNEARKSFLQRFGRLNEKFFELLPKSLAFKPISNVKDFVFSYILEEKDVNVENLRENIRTFREFEDVLNEFKVKISILEKIESKYREYDNASKIVNLHEYIVILAEIEEIKEKIKISRENINAYDVKIESFNNLINILRNEIDSKSKYLSQLNAELLSNSDYSTLNDLNKDLDILKKEYEKVKLKKESFLELLKSQKNYVKTLLNSLDDNNIKDFYNNMNSLTLENLDDYKILSKTMEDYLESLKNSKFQLVAEKNYSLGMKENEKNKLERSISELEKRNLQYKPEVVKLRNGIIIETKKLGHIVEPKILCELLEITDEKWKNAVEGYLNTQRFYLLVEKEDFDTVIKIYERLIKSEGIHSVGIINTNGLECYENPKENSLAEVVTSKSSDAKRFINMILGKVIRCENTNELKKYPTSITPTCMMYQNNVARAINPKIYKTPYIGAEAYKEQLKQSKEKLNVLTCEITKLKDEIKNNNNHIKLLNKINLQELREKSNILLEFNISEKKLNELEKEIKELEKNNSYMEIQIKCNDVSEKIAALKKEEKDNNDKITELLSSCKLEEHNIKDMEERLKYINLSKEDKEKNIGSLKSEGKERLKKERLTKSYKTIKDNFSVSIARNKTIRNNIENEIIKLQTNYNYTYEFGKEVGIAGIKDFLDALAYIKNTKVIEYEEKVKEARKRSEEEFKEHFISKIQENIITAKSEFKELNKGLKGVMFGNEEYVFKIGKSKENNEYYDMIMDDENIGEGYTLFSTSFENKHKELLNELFEKLTLDDESNEAELRKLTDYRNYMSYDIEIKYDNGTSSLFSKVCREKSGGETQTPFYVAMAASFLQLYKSVGGSNDAIGLILFDEAFDKMDDVRIMAMMKFYNKLNLQMIIAAPPQKIESITPYVNTVLLAIKGNDFSFVEGMINEKL